MKIKITCQWPNNFYFSQLVHRFFIVKIYTWWIVNLQPQLPPILEGGGGGGGATFSKALWLLNNLYLISYSTERKLDNSNKQLKVTIFGNDSLITINHSEQQYFDKLFN